MLFLPGSLSLISLSLISDRILIVNIVNLFLLFLFYSTFALANMISRTVSDFADLRFAANAMTTAENRRSTAADDAGHLRFSCTGQCLCVQREGGGARWTSHLKQSFACRTGLSVLLLTELIINSVLTGTLVVNIIINDISVINDIFYR